MRACIYVRDRARSHWKVFSPGLQRLGYEIDSTPSRNPQPSDVLLLWNRRVQHEAVARNYERVGARVLVAENGYIGRDPQRRKIYALAHNHHAGAGVWREGAPERWEQFGVGLQPWRTDGRHILVLPQRGIGESGVAMPRRWPFQIVERLRKVTPRPIRVRHHPGTENSEPYGDLAGAWAAVVWASGAGIKALAFGIPVFYDFPKWIGASAALPCSEDIERPFLGDRLPMFRRLAWAQWRADEIASGEAFAWLLKS